MKHFLRPTIILVVLILMATAAAGARQHKMPGIHEPGGPHKFKPAFSPPTNGNPRLVFSTTVGGGLDPSFGTGGSTRTFINGGDGSNDNINSVAIQTDGKIVAAGYSYGWGHYAFALERFNTDGSLDSTFGTNGNTRTYINGGDTWNDQARSVAIQSDGKIVAAGCSHDASGTVQWPTDGAPVSTALGNQYNPAMTSDGAGGAIITWDDFGTGTTTDSYASRVTSTGTLPTPQIEVSPDTLEASLYSGDMTTQTITISNTGTADLTFMINESSPPGILAVSKSLKLNRVPAARQTIVTNTSSSGFRVLLLSDDDDNDHGSPIRNELLSYPDIRQVDLFDGRWGTPTLSLLQTYDAVVAWHNLGWANAAAVGNVLADYVDAGGGVVLAALNWGNNLGTTLTGRIMDTSYTPLTGYGYYYSPASMVIVDSSHPIMDGVTYANDAIHDYTSLTSGAHLIAQWSNGEKMVAVKGQIVGINSYFGYWRYGFSGDIPLIVHNSIRYVGGAPWLSKKPFSDTISAGGSAVITVTFDATGLGGGDYYANLLIHSNDLTHSTVTVPVQLHVTGAPNIVVGDTAIDFGSCVLDDAPKSISFVVSNTGTDTLAVSNVSSSENHFSADTTVFSLAPGESRNVGVSFSPGSVGTFNGTLTIVSNDPTGGTKTVALKGTCVTSYGAGSALSFNGSNWVDAPAFSWAAGGPITIEFWNKVDATPSTASSAFSLGNQELPYRIQAHVPWTDNTLYWDYGGNLSGPGDGRITADYTPYLGKWTHVALVSAGNGGNWMAIYLNGVLVASYTGSTVGASFTASGARIGAFIPCYHQGAIDEFRVWSVVRTTQEIREHMRLRLHGNESGLIGYWRFDEDTGTLAFDGSSSGNNGTVCNGAAWVTSTAPFGTGSSASLLGFTSGTDTLGTLILSASSPFPNPLDITATQITAPPNSLPVGSGTILGDRYWVIDTFTVSVSAHQSPTKSFLLMGKKTLSFPPVAGLNLTFTVPQDFTNNGAANPSLYTLYSRGGNSDSVWTTSISGASVLTATGVTFDYMTAYGQLALGTDDALPIQLASFTAVLVEGGKVQLDWMTVSEVNNYGFFIERRTESGEFSELPNSFIAGAGTTLEQHNYSWTDENVQAGTYYYRLRQVDLNGDVSYSHEIIVNTVLGVRDEIAPREFSLKQNYPNPFNPTTEIKFSVERQEHATVTVYSILGEEVAQLFNGIAEPGHYYRLAFDGSRLGSGLYFYRIVTSSHVSVKKMLMIK